MKVKVNRPTVVDFGDIHAGQVFMWDKHYYLAYCGEDEEIHAIHLSSNCECNFSSTTTVYPVDAEVVING